MNIEKNVELYLVIYGFSGKVIIHNNSDKFVSTFYYDLIVIFLETTISIDIINIEWKKY